MKIYYIFILSLLIGLASCTDDMMQPSMPGEGDNELPIDFTFLLPEDEAGTRSISNPKTNFSEGDIIHIQGIFQALYNDQETTMIRYGAFRKVKNGWDTVPGSKMKWPNMATTGTFTAYYISGSTGLLTLTDPLKTNMTNMATNADPLKAQSASDIEYGRGVRMQFQHLCAYLTLEELEPLVSDNYWITANPDDPGSVINNGFQLSLNSDNTLNFEFIAIPDPDYDNMVYVGGTSINYETSQNGQLETHTLANFFLEPGTYDSFMIKYPGLAPVSYEFLKYDFNEIQAGAGGEGTENIVPQLNAGNTYVLNVTKSPGITILAPPSAEGWDESDNYYIVDVPSFLEAASSGGSYYDENGVQILEGTASGSRLLHNVDFQFYEYNGLFDNFIADINEGSIFDGDYHYIKNIASPIFRYNYGTIKDLGLKSINATLVTDENDDSGHDFSRMGMVCQWNYLGTLSNIRIPEGGTITGLVNQEFGASPENETHNLGIVTGSNTGTIDGVELGGIFDFTLSGYYTAESPSPMAVDITVLFGGICGQNAGTISNIMSPDNNLTLNLINNCVGNTGALYTGGMVGSSSGSMDNIVVQTLNIDCSGSEGLTLYTGGMVGELTTSGGSAGLTGLNNCIASGSIKTGTASPYSGSDAQSAAYTGGLAGALLNIPVYNSRVAIDITGPSSSLSEVLYATGGIFGRIRTNSQMGNLIGYGTVLTGVPYIGNFAGIVPTGMTWTDYQDMGITVRQFTNISNIGIDASFISE